MLHLILYQPEIPPNTGNVIRLSANAGARLHLIKPIAFDLSEKAVRRAGMDYAELAHVEQWDSLDQCLQQLSAPRWFAISTRGITRYDQVAFQDGDALVFGPETRGLPPEILDRCPPAQRLRIPMRPGNRSLNLSNAVAVVTYEAWRQRGFS
ncbi:MAG: tRNA (cytidine(34)-2'-O)-methyltransferase [Povalibacter sp.]